MVEKAKTHFGAMSAHAKGVVLGALSAVFVSGYILVNRFVYNQYDVDPFSYSVTFALAGGLFAALGLTIRYYRHGGVGLARKSPSRLFAIGLAGGSSMGLIVLGQNYTTAVNAAIVMTASILSTAFFSWLILKESFSGRQRMWLAIMFVGLYLGIVGLHIVALQPGDLIILGAMVILGFNNVLSKTAMKWFDGNFIADARLTISAVLMLLAGLVFVGPDVVVLSAGLWPLLAGLFFWLCIRTFYGAIQLISANKTIVLNNGQIFFTAIIGVLLLSESYDWIKFVGSAIVLLSVYFISKK